MNGVTFFCLMFWIHSVIGTIVCGNLFHCIIKSEGKKDKTAALVITSVFAVINILVYMNGEYANVIAPQYELGADSETVVRYYVGYLCAWALLSLLLAVAVGVVLMNVALVVGYPDSLKRHALVLGENFAIPLCATLSSISVGYFVLLSAFGIADFSTALGWIT